MVTAVDILNNIIDAINAFPFATVNFYGQIVGALISIVLFAGIIIVFQKIGALGGEKKGIMGDTGLAKTHEIIRAELKHREESQKAWRSVLEKIYSANASDWLAAVIQADAIMDDILKRMGLPGETMADRLQALDTSKLKSLQDVWDAHKLRNRVAHAPATMLRHDELLGAIEKYKKALKELKYID